MDKVNPTLEYTAPCTAFGDQEIILISPPGRDDRVRVLLNLDYEGVDSRRAPTS